MNYHGNMDTYYSYANANIKVNKKERVYILTWILLILAILLFIWTYTKYFYVPISGNTNNTIERTNSSTVTLVDLVNKKLPTQTHSINTQTIKKVATVPTIELQKESTKSHTVEATKTETMNYKEVESSKSIANQSSVLPLSKITDSDILENKKITQNEDTLHEVESSKSIANQTLVLPLSKITDSNKITQKEKEELPLDLYHLYIVAKGESIYQIAKQQYGSTEMYIEIIKANPDLDNPNNIREGEEILLPIIDESKSYSQILRFR